jgi:two-component system response regulator HydG
MKILVVDDDIDTCNMLRSYLTRHDFNVSVTTSGKSAIDLVTSFKPDIALCDFRLGDMDGNALLMALLDKLPGLPVVIMTGYSDVRTAVNIMKLGACDYITKPLLPDEIIITLRNALARSKVAGKVKISVNKTSRATFFPTGKGGKFEALMRQVKLVAPTDFSVIIQGESGSGKESIANEIHNQSARSNSPFIAIDCGSLSRELAASELFGHEKGSFTGALQQKIGSFELADGGTIFLDEIGNLSYEIQVALLRVVQERKIRHVGGLKDIDLNVRIIVATNERLSEMVKQGKFRDDLYHRFNEFSIDVPPLRERREDIMALANFFLEQTNEALAKSVKGFSGEVCSIFTQYKWPGNLRELHNVVKRATLLTSSELIETHALPFEIVHFDRLQFELNKEDQLVPANLGETSIKQASLEAEFHVIEDALRKCNYNKTKAARLLNIDRKTLYNKMKVYRLLSGKDGVKTIRYQ